MFSPFFRILVLMLLLGLSACVSPGPRAEGQEKESFAAQLEAAKPQWRERFEAWIAQGGAQWTPETKEAQWQQYWAEVVRRTKAEQAEMARLHVGLKVVGTVVDQFGQPVKGAVLEMEAKRDEGSGYLLGLRSDFQTLHAKTDAEGHFRVSASRVLSIGLENIEAPGCQFYKDIQPAWYFHASDEGGHSSLYWDLRKRGPVTFVLWRLVGEPERLLQGETQLNHLCRLPARQALCFGDTRLLEADKIDADGKNADLLIDMLPNPKDPSGETTILRLTAPPGGGVAPGNWYEFFAPPDERYVASTEFEVRGNATPCIFLKARDARGYAKIMFHVAIRANEKAMGVDLEYYLNPWGSRNLQLGNQEREIGDGEIRAILRKQAEKQAQGAKPAEQCAPPTAPANKPTPPAAGP